MNNVYRNIFAAAFCFAFTPCLAQDIPSLEKSGFYLSFGNVSFEPTAAAKEDVGDSASYIKFGYENQTHNIIWALGLSGFLYDDKASFTNQTVTNYSNKVSTSKSSAESLNGYAELGYNVAFDAIDLTILGGYEAVFSSERAIPNCTEGCQSFNIDISSGLYLHPRIKYSFKNDWYLAFSLHSYLSGDAKQSALLTVGAHF